MIESPLINEIVSEHFHKTILGILDDRLGDVPSEISETVREIVDAEELSELTRFASVCPDLKAFASRLRPS